MTKRKEEWRQLSVIVEIPVRGDFTEADLRWCVAEILLNNDIKRWMMTDATFGRPVVKSLSRVIASLIGRLRKIRKIKELKLLDEEGQV